jgi:ABC-type sugar transport system substrate-binding protein
MKRMTTLAGATAMAITALILTGCSGPSGGGGGESSAPGTDFKIEGIGINASDPFYQTLMCGATKEAKTLGVTLQWTAPNTQSVPEQQSALDAAALKNPDGILLAPGDATSFSTKIQTMMNQGTPVMTANLAPDPPTSLGTIQSSTDNTAFIDFVTKDMGTTGKIGILGGLAGGSAVLQNRWKPLVAQLKASAPGIKILDTQYSDFDRNKAATIVAAMITANPDLTAVYAVSGPDGEGAAAAVEEAGKTGKIKVYAYDATPGEVDALKAGTITALLAQPAGLLGSESLKELVSFLKDNPDHKTVPASDKATDLDLKVVTKDNLDDEDTVPYIYSNSCSS